MLRPTYARHALSLLGAGALVLAGCSSQADTTYRGEPLASLQGTVQNAAPVSSPIAAPLAAALLWSGTRPGADAKASVSRKEVGTSVPVSGQFPSSFSLQVYTPPPAAALFSCFVDQPDHPAKIASAGVFAILEGASTSTLTYLDIYGQVRDYTLVYVAADIPAVSDCPYGALAKGYHLFKFVPAPDKPGCVRQAPDDPSCNGPWPYVEVPMSTSLTLDLFHEDGKATPPPGGSGPPGAGKP